MSNEIAVIMRLDPDPAEQFEITEDAAALDTEWIGFRTNEFDECALEAALLLKDHDATVSVTVLTIERDGAERLLQTSLARGADRAFMLTVDENSPLTENESIILYEYALNTLKIGRAFVGVQSANDMFGQLGPRLAARLECATVNVVDDVEADGDRLIALQDYGGGNFARIALPGRVVVGVQTAVNPPRYVSGTQLREIRKNGRIEKIIVPRENINVISDRGVHLTLPHSNLATKILTGDIDNIARRLLSEFK